MKLSRFSLVFLFALLTACNFSLAADVTPPPGYQPPTAKPTDLALAGPLFPLVPPDPTKAAATFAEKCAPCHGTTGNGDGPRSAQLPNPPASLGAIETARQAVPEQWFKIVSQGNLERMMPPFQSLSDRERWDVVAYALNLSIPPATLQQGADLYQQNCARCHGQSGQGDGPDSTGKKVAAFSNQEGMASKSLADFEKTIDNGSDAMPSFHDKLSADQRWALASYVRQFSFMPTVANAVSTSTPASQQTLAVGAASSLTTTLAVSSTAQITSSVGAVLTNTIGVVTGLVTNGSGGAMPPGSEVMLHAFDDMQVAFTQTTQLDDKGSYFFGELEMIPGRTFLTTMKMGGVIYSSDFGTVEAGKDRIDLPIQVYESTTDTSALRIDRLHYFLEMAGTNNDTLRVGELYIISNPTQKTVTGAQPGGPVLQFKLPPDAQNLQFQDGALGGRYLATSDGFADTMAVRPGEAQYQVLFAYELPAKRKIELSRPVFLPITDVVIMTPNQNITVSGQNIQDGGTRDVQGTQYHMYTAGPLQPGSDFQMTVNSGSTSSLIPSLTQGNTAGLFVGLGALGLALVVAGVWLYLRSRKNTVPALALDDGESAEAAPESSEALMDAILALDDLHQEGKLPDEAYRQRRADLKVRLKDALEKEG
jgi:mono/diheme cytochrome c family protein